MMLLWWLICSLESTVVTKQYLSLSIRNLMFHHVSIQHISEMMCEPKKCYQGVHNRKVLCMSLATTIFNQQILWHMARSGQQISLHQKWIEPVRLIAFIFG